MLESLGPSALASSEAKRISIRGRRCRDVYTDCSGNWAKRFRAERVRNKYIYDRVHIYSYTMLITE